MHRGGGPQDWAATQGNLGTACSDLPTGDRGENLRRAIERLGAALRTIPRRQRPRLGKDPNNLRIAYANLPTGDRGENLHRAIECYEAALRVWTEEEAPRTEYGRQRCSPGVSRADDSRERLRAILRGAEPRLDPDDPDTWISWRAAAFRWSGRMKPGGVGPSPGPRPGVVYRARKCTQWRYDEAARRAAQA